MKTLTVVHITWGIGVGGMEQMLVDIANEQSRTANVWVVVVNDSVDPLVSVKFSPSIKLRCLGRKEGSRSPFPLLRLNYLLHRIRPDIIHVHHWNHRKLLVRPPGKVVLTVHTTGEEHIFDKTGRYERVFGISQSVVEEIRSRRQDIQPTVVSNGVQCSQIRCQPRRQDHLFRIAQVGRLEHQHKGQDILLRAVARLRAEPAGDALRLDLIGTGRSRSYLENLAHDLGIQDITTFRGTVGRSHVYEELCEYDLLVQPSRYEGFGLTVVEAMAAGVPVLVSDAEGPREIVEKGQYGFLFQPENDQDCSRQIQRIREMKAAGGLKDLVAAARERALEQFDVKRTADEYLHRYAELVESEKVRPARSSTLRNVVGEGFTSRRACKGHGYMLFRNFACGLLAVGLIASGRVRNARRGAFREGVITALYYHKPNKRLFERCINWLIRHGYTFISTQELITILSAHLLPPKGAVWLSFDDGCEQLENTVIPVARRFRIPIALFIPSGIVDGDGAFPWLRPMREAEPGATAEASRDALTVAELKRIADYPEVTIGSHTVSHALTPNLSEQQLHFELGESKRQLQSWICAEVDCFAYPVGQYDGCEKAILQELGYKLAATTDNNFITAGTDVYLVPRFSIGDEISFPEAICNMVGVWRPVIEPLSLVAQRIWDFFVTAVRIRDIRQKVAALKGPT